MTAGTVNASITLACTFLSIKMKSSHAAGSIFLDRATSAYTITLGGGRRMSAGKVLPVLSLGEGLNATAIPFHLTLRKYMNIRKNFSITS